MLDKKQLLSLDLPRLPKKRTDTIYRTKSISYLVKSKTALNGKLLIVAFYERAAAANGFSIPTCVLYITKKEYITLVSADGRRIWKNSRICHVLGTKDKDGKCVCMTERDEQRIRSFLPVERKPAAWESTGIDAHISRYQDGILEVVRDEKKKRLANQVDLAMKAVPPLPKAFDKWIDREPLLHSRYIYYRRTTKAKASCFCTHCKGNMVFDKVMPVHNGTGACPSCKSKVTFKAIGKSKKVSDEAYACILQKAKNGGYLLRYFRVVRNFYGHYTNPETKLYERARLFFSADGTITGQYKHGWSSKTGRRGWYPTRDVITGKNNAVTWELKIGMYIRVWNAWFHPSNLYPCNLRPMLTGLNLSYDIIGNIKGRAVDVTTYLMRSMAYQFAPALWRIGLERMCADLLEECFEPRIFKPVGSLHTRFGISKQFISLMRNHSLGMEAVNLRAMMDKEPDGEEFLWALENKVDGKDLSILLKYTTFHKVKTYTERQAKIKILGRGQWGEVYNAKDIIGFWKDYISMCEKLEYNLSKKSVLFPKNIKDEHDKAAQLIRIKHDPVMDVKIKDAYPVLNQSYYYEDDDYLIRPPKDFDEFVQEGTKLLHCVCSNGYYKGHVEGTRLILFIRKKKKPGVPYYTMEYSPASKRVIQCHGYRHMKPVPKVKGFTEEWLGRFTGAHDKKIAA